MLEEAISGLISVFMQHRYEINCLKIHESQAYCVNMWRDFNIFGPQHILMSGSLAKNNFELAAKLWESTTIKPQ